jgi:hypothetical protein
MALSYWIWVAEHLNRPETGYLGEKVQESVCPCRFAGCLECVIPDQVSVPETGFNHDQKDCSVVSILFSMPALAGTDLLSRKFSYRHAPVEFDSSDFKLDQTTDGEYMGLGFDRQGRQ